MIIIFLFNHLRIYQNNDNSDNISMCIYTEFQPVGDTFATHRLFHPGGGVHRGQPAERDAAAAGAPATQEAMGVHWG